MRSWSCVIFACAEAGDLLVFLRVAALLLRRLLRTPLQVVPEVRDLLVLVREARAPLHFLFFVEPLDVHQLGDLREIGIARGHLSSLADALLDLREELAE